MIFMEQKKLKRIAIIGLPGSGKSTFTPLLGDIKMAEIGCLNGINWQHTKYKWNFIYAS